MTLLKFGVATLMPLLALSAGCNYGPPPSDGPAPGIPDVTAISQVNFTSTDLANATRVGQVVNQVDGNGIMHLSVPIRAITDYDITVEYRFTYMDETHALVDQPTGWIARTLHAGTVDVFSATAPSPRARDFRLDVRYAQIQ